MGILFAKRLHPKVSDYLHVNNLKLNERSKKLMNEQQIIEMNSPTITEVNINDDDTQVSASQNKIITTGHQTILNIEKNYWTLQLSYEQRFSFFKIIMSVL